MNSKRLYQILFPNNALVASQLLPEDFARHYISGTTRYYHGRILFAEIDIGYRHPYFDIDNGLAGLVAHNDGRPKATKFIASYRVLEHINFDAIKKLFLTTPEGFVLELPETTYTATSGDDYFRIYAEIVPLRMLVLTRHSFLDFSRFITDPLNQKGAPVMLYSQLDIDVESLVSAFEKDPFIYPPIEELHPARLRDAVRDMRGKPDKHTKGLCLDSSFEKIPYKYVKHGFMFASQEKSKFFQMPGLKEIEKINFRFWKNM